MTVDPGCMVARSWKKRVRDQVVRSENHMAQWLCGWCCLLVHARCHKYYIPCLKPCRYLKRRSNRNCESWWIRLRMQFAWIVKTRGQPGLRSLYLPPMPLFLIPLDVFVAITAAELTDEWELTYVLYEVPILMNVRYIGRIFSENSRSNPLFLVFIICPSLYESSCQSFVVLFLLKI